METLLSADLQGERPDFVHSVLPLLKLITLTVIGLILTHPKTQLVPRETMKLLSELVFSLFLPCLIFIHLGEAITYRNLQNWWFIPVNLILSTGIGCLLGLLVALICKPPPEFIRFTIIMTGFGNNDNLPLAIVGSVCRSPKTPFGQDCLENGTAYVSFSQLVAVFLVYTLVYHMMGPPSDEDLIRPFLDGGGEGLSRSRFMAGGGHEIASILNPLTLATLVACFIGVVPPLKSVFYGSDAPLSFVTDTLEIAAGAIVPSVMLILGGIMAEGPKESQLGIRTTVGIIAARLVVLPVIGIGVISAAEKVGFLVPGDQMFKFVALLQYTSPSAILLGAVGSLRGHGAGEASALLFWQHVFAVFFVSFYVLVYFRMLLHYT